MLKIGLLIAALAVTFALLFGSSSKLLPVEPGDTVLVTGSSTGIGKHAVLSLVKEGYTVFACVRKPKDGDALIKSAENFGLNTSQIRVLILDVTKLDDIQRGVETVTEFVGDRGLKGLFNNAGIGGDLTAATGMASGSVEFGDTSQWRQVMEVNYFGLLEVTKAFLRLLRRGKGRIINNASVAGYLAGPFVSYYTASKFAVEGFSDSLRRELRPLDVKVSVLEPGFVATPIFNEGKNMPRSMEPYREAEIAFFNGFFKDALGAPTPKVTSQAVIHAMRAETPKLRYVVGKDAPVLKILRYIPSTWLDVMIEKNNQANPAAFTEEELLEMKKHFQQSDQTDFDL